MMFSFRNYCYQYKEKMNRKFVEKSICLEPSFLGNNLHEALLQKVRQTWVGKCTKQDGYIINIERIARIIDNYISPSTNSVVFSLFVEATILKPEIGLQLDAKVNYVLSQGIFACTEGKLKFLIPYSQLTEYSFASGEFKQLEKPEVTIKMNDTIPIEITAIRYEKNNFDCIARCLL
jgi:DNA-directed RNA polymerase subunit E'/Rpb7